MSPRPRIQSLVWQDAHAPGSRTLICTGLINDCTKLNWPIGHTYLQNDAPRKNPSITKAAAKYARTIQAVHHGLSQRANASYAHRKPKSNETANHLFRSQTGQL